MKNFKVTEKYKHEERNYALSIRTPYEYCANDRHNQIHIGFMNYSWWIRIPEIIKPKAKWVDTSGHTWSNESGGYTNYIQRVYGFTTFDDGIHIYYGIQPGCWSSTDKKNSDHVTVFDIPWLTRRRVRYDYYTCDGKHWMNANDFPSGRIDSEKIKECRNTVPRTKFKFNDFDGEEITASCYITEAEYVRGTGLFKWLRFVTKSSIYRNLEIEFDKEVGPKKGSWKGGVLGMLVEIQPGEEAITAFKKLGFGLTHTRQDFRFSNITELRSWE